MSINRLNSLNCVIYLLAATLITPVVELKAQEWGAGKDYTGENPAGAWSYGRTWSATSEVFDPFTVHSTGTPLPEGWWFGNLTHGGPALQAAVGRPGIAVWAKDNSNGLPCVRWICPEDGTYVVSGRFESSWPSMAVDVYATIVNEVVFEESILSDGESREFSIAPRQLQAGDDVEFIVRWNGANGDPEANWTLVYAEIVKLDPDPSIHWPSDRIVVSGGTTEFSVTPIDDMQAYTYQWFFNDQLIFGAHESTFRIEDASTLMEGDYHCRVTNGDFSIDGPKARLAVVDFDLGIHRAIHIEFPTSLGERYCLKSSGDLETWTSVPGYESIEGTGDIVVLILSLKGEPARRYFKAEVVAD